MDGHLVQGHIDCTAKCIDIIDDNGSWVYAFEYDISEDLANKGYFRVEKGSQLSMVWVLPYASLLIIVLGCVLYLILMRILIFINYK